MRILHIINNLKSEGAQNLVINIASNSLQGENNNDFFLLEGQNHFQDKFPSEKSKIQYAGKGNYKLINPFALFRILKSNTYDVVHSHLFPSNYITAIVLVFFPKIACVTTVHSTNNRRRSSPIIMFFESLLFRRYNKIIGVSNAVTKNNISTYKIDIDRFATINNGINLKFSESKIDSPLIRYVTALKRKSFVLMMVARFAKVKNHQTVISSLKYLPDDVHLVLIGDGDEVDNIKALTNSLQLNDRTHFLGKTNNVFSLLKMANISIIASLWEGFGLVAVESMACGVPTIASNVNGLSEIGEDALVYFDPSSPKDLASKVSYLKENPDKCGDLITKGLKRSKLFDINFTVAEYVKLYELVNDKPNSSS